MNKKEDLVKDLLLALAGLFGRFIPNCYHAMESLTKLVIRCNKHESLQCVCSTYSIEFVRVRFTQVPRTELDDVSTWFNCLFSHVQTP